MPAMLPLATETVVVPAVTLSKLMFPWATVSDKASAKLKWSCTLMLLLAKAMSSASSASALGTCTVISSWIHALIPSGLLGRLSV